MKYAICMLGFKRSSYFYTLKLKRGEPFRNFRIQNPQTALEIMLGNKNIGYPVERFTFFNNLPESYYQQGRYLVTVFIF
jgi:hypothetical protein